MTAPSPDWDAERIVAHLDSLSSDENRAGMARFGIKADRAFGVPNAVLRPLARALKKDHARALALWRTGWREARLLATFTDEPEEGHRRPGTRLGERFLIRGRSSTMPPIYTAMPGSPSCSRRNSRRMSGSSSAARASR